MEKAKSLADLAQLMNRTPGTIKMSKITDAAPLMKEYSLKAAVENLVKSLGIAGEDIDEDELYVALSGAYQAGRREGEADSRAISSAASTVYHQRGELLLPVCVAAVMEQCSLTSMILDLPMVASVFHRVELATSISDDNKQVVYNLVHRADKRGMK